jgi:hypothetical protein
MNDDDSHVVDSSKKYNLVIKESKFNKYLIKE